MLTRAYSTLELKAVDEEKRTISGVASTPIVDRQGDVVLPEGAEFEREISLLLHHDSKSPVGIARLKHAKDAVLFEASIPHITEPGRLRDRVDEAWHSLKHRLIRGVSIGFRSLDGGTELLKNGGLLFKATEILELSLVAVPANQQALIHSLKSIDAPHLAASGQSSAEPFRNPSQARGTPAVRLLPSRQEQSMKSIQEQILNYKSTRDQKFQDKSALMTTAADAGRTLEGDEEAKYDELDGEVKALDAHIKRLESLQDEQKLAAKPAVGTDPIGASASRGGTPVITVKSNLPPGIGFARLAIAKIAARLEGSTVMEVAKQRWPDYGELQKYIQKAAVPAGTTTDATWASPLVYAENLPGEFLEYLRPRTLLGRIPNLRRVPFNVRFTSQTSGAVANWVGQGRAKPVTSFSTAAQTLAYTKIAAIAVITEELARFSSPSAETMVRDELARAVIERMDIDFIDPAQAAVANVNPASITNGLTALSSAGVAEANIRTDLTNLLSSFVELNVDPTNLVLLMPNTLALGASLMVNSLGQPSFPGLSTSGGTLMGIPVITSQYAANQSGYGNLVIAVDQSSIFLADDGQVTLDASREASIQMSDAPTNDASTGSGQSLVSMYQTNSIAVRAERYINWLKARTTAVSYIDDANWGSIGSPS